MIVASTFESFMNVIGYYSAVPKVVIEPKSKSSSNILTAGIKAFY